MPRHPPRALTILTVIGSVSRTATRQAWPSLVTGSGDTRWSPGLIVDAGDRADRQGLEVDLLLWLLCSSQGPPRRAACRPARHDGLPADRRSLKTQQHARPHWAMCPPTPRGRRCLGPCGPRTVQPAKSGRRFSHAVGGRSSSPGGGPRKRVPRVPAPRGRRTGAGCGAVPRVLPYGRSLERR
jgi:hypothetical protein